MYVLMKLERVAAAKVVRQSTRWARLEGVRVRNRTSVEIGDISRLEGARCVRNSHV